MTRKSPRSTWLSLGLLALGLALGLPAPGLASGGGGGGDMGGGSMGGEMRRAKPKTPAELAQASYASGLAHRDRALAFEAKAAVSDTSWLGKPPSEKAVDQWRAAVTDYETAIETKRSFHEAHSDLGFALRKLGDYAASLAAYDKALELSPDYTPAIEYRGEAYLRLGRLEDGKQAYMRLFTLDRPLAAQLLGEMQKWLAEAEAKPAAGISAEALAQFRTWVAERSQLAAQSGQDLSDARSW